MQHFDELELPESLNHTLAHMEFSTPTPIQAQAIPPALLGKDILGTAQTGTGKTAAFGIPLAVNLLTDTSGTALVMTPTRELAGQVMQQMQSILGRRSHIKNALLIGGEAMPKQLQQLRNKPRRVVGTPGRIFDHLERGTLTLQNTHFLVLDETDRMLDMGFTVQIEKILKFLPARRQTLLFSATMPKNIEKIAQKYLEDPVRISVGAVSKPVENIKQTHVKLDDGAKYGQLLTELNARAGSIIVFVKTKYGAERMAKKLRNEGQSADAIHGDLRQNKRNRVIADFRKQKSRVLVATDVAARGLDIPHIEHVINYDIPQVPEDYVHRIGRTARAGAEGEAVIFLSPTDASKWYAVQKMLHPDDPAYAKKPGQDKAPSGNKGVKKRNASTWQRKNRPAKKD